MRVVLPLATPGLAATAVFCLIVSWNEFLFALILTQTEAAMTLPVGIAGQVTQYEIKWGIMSAAGVVAMLPILVFALAVQRYLVRGLSLGALLEDFLDDCVGCRQVHGVRIPSGNTCLHKHLSIRA